MDQKKKKNNFANTDIIITSSYQQKGFSNLCNKNIISMTKLYMGHIFIRMYI